jgi:RNA polymerase sigma-70 factor (ECF subfamily)
MYFGRYAKEDVRLAVAQIEGRLALAAFVSGAARPTYFMLLEWDGDRLSHITDYRYVSYIAAEADFEMV